MILVFDFDGTLHKTDELYKKSFYKCLENNKIKRPKLDVVSYLGYPPRNIWDDFLDDSFDKDALIKEVGFYMEKFMKDFGKLYENTENTLKILKKKHTLIICSSCSKSYIRAARKIYRLDRFFENYLIGEDFSYKEKHEILEKSLNQDFIMIGDRLSDVIAANKNNQISIFAKYGYGEEFEGKDADIKIEKIEDLLKIKVLGK